MRVSHVRAVSATLSGPPVESSRSAAHDLNGRSWHEVYPRPKLRTDCYCTGLNTATPLAEQIEGLNSAVRAGKVRHIASTTSIER